MEIKFVRRLLPIKSLLFVGITLASSYASAFWGYDPSLLKTIDAGSIQGSTDNYDTHAFKSIPYAAAPIGDLRWRAPQDPNEWEGVRDASEFGSICTQKGTFWGTDKPEEFSTVIGNEDCLFLNVWRPNNHSKHLPVLLWIHGGGNIIGSGSFDNYNGAHLAAEANAIVVSINYRLGVMGWLFSSFADNGNLEDASGNYALLDIIKSLDWVQDNIRTFGGNPNKVTIAGNSAGCGSVWGLLHSPLAEDLFHRAICSAGSVGGTPVENGQALSNAFTDYLLVVSGLATDPATAAAFRLAQGDAWVGSFMRSIPADAFAAALNGVPSYYIDGYVLPEISRESVAAGAFNKVPMMIGSTKNESSYILAAFVGLFNGKGRANSPLLWEQINADPTTLSFNDIIDPVVHDNYTSIEQAFSYAWNLDTDYLVSSTRENNRRVYRYDLNWDDVPAPWDQAFGAMHSLDTAFLFGNFITDKDNVHRYAWSEENQASREQLSEQFMKYVGRFMRTGNPNAGWGLPYWPRWNNTERAHRRTRIQLDEVITNSSEKYNSEEYVNMVEALDPAAKGIVELWTQRFGFQLSE